MRSIHSVEDVFEALAAGGGEAYFGEPVTVLEHSLQAAWFVQRKNASESLVVAALLHDLGHLLHEEGEDAAERGLDTRHEELGAIALSGHLPDAVLEPIRMHVDAKRYLCAADARYFATLSPASVQSLTLQGGPMTAEEAAAFLAKPFATDAVTLRNADDAAKVKDLRTPGLEAYEPLVAQFWD
jgi:[1-hydroxy-2-(trimethylamino)ethyl]phosphonate dioxygenase